MGSAFKHTKIGEQTDLPVGIFRKMGRRGTVIAYNVSTTVDGIHKLVCVSVSRWGIDGALQEAIRIRKDHIANKEQPKNVDPFLVELFAPLKEIGLLYAGLYRNGYQFNTKSVDGVRVSCLWRPERRSLKATVSKCLEKGVVLKPFDFDAFEAKVKPVLLERSHEKL